jgi:phosphonate ABC transporter permease subunit PhnE
MRPQRGVLRSVGIGLAVIVVVAVYAFGFSVTDVNFETTRDETRLEQLTRILRALAHPDVIEYEQEELFVQVPFHMPCPEGGAPPTVQDTSGPYIVMIPECANARDFVQVDGFNLPPNTEGPINFIPPSGASLTLGFFKSDDDGNFSIKTELPNRQPVEEAQTIRAISRRNIGAPHFSPLAITTKDKIIETVFLALLATTFGIVLAIPLSFVAARNLMAEVRSPLTSVSLSLLGWPLGILLGSQLAARIGDLGDTLSSSTAANIGSLIASPIVIWGVFTWAVPREDDNRSNYAMRFARGAAFVLAAGVGILFLYMLGKLSLSVGEALVEPLGAFGFLGNFVFQLGDSLRMLTPMIAAVVGAGAIGGFTGRLGQQASDRLSNKLIKTLNLPLAAFAGAVLFALIGAGIDWFYQMEDPVRTLWGPAALGATLGAVLALRTAAKASLPIGLTIYGVVRTLLNATRSVEPLIMVIVFVVWVGIGPFAGALALGLHTVAALAKLFSEQVESILPGPLEAVQATGANRLQTIMYAVIPQIVPPYISFTMYRWDINVRMSTIIGFAGGGGIGFLLQQNIRLLDYRGASTQMLAIAIVVASMDYISSTLRQRFV